MTNRSSDVLVTGIGVLSPIGLSIAELERSLLNNRSGIGLWQSEALSKPVPAGQIGTDFSDRFSKLELPYLDRCSQIAMLAADQAIDDAGLAGFAECGQRAGLFYGSVAGGVKTEHDWVKQFERDRTRSSRPFTIMASMLNAAPALISIRHKIQGPVVTNSSACSSSGVSIGEGFRAIRDGYLDMALVGGQGRADRHARAGPGRRRRSGIDANLHRPVGRLAGTGRALRGRCRTKLPTILGGPYRPRHQRRRGFPDA